MVEIVDEHNETQWSNNKGTDWVIDNTANTVNTLVISGLPGCIWDFIALVDLEDNIRTKILGHLKNNVIRNSQATPKECIQELNESLKRLTQQQQNKEYHKGGYTEEELVTVIHTFTRLRDHLEQSLKNKKEETKKTPKKKKWKNKKNSKKKRGKKKNKS